MFFYKMDDEKIVYRCACGVDVTAPIEKLRVMGQSVFTGECPSCKRGGYMMLAGQVDESASSYEQHRFNQTLGKRLLDAGQALDAIEDCCSIGDDYKDGEVFIDLEKWKSVVASKTVSAIFPELEKDE